jgi:hypothetical protein
LKHLQQHVQQQDKLTLEREKQSVKTAQPAPRIRTHNRK